MAHTKFILPILSAFICLPVVTTSYAMESGAYIGAVAGYGATLQRIEETAKWSGSDVLLLQTEGATSAMPGLQAGYNYKFNRNFYAGIDVAALYPNRVHRDDIDGKNNGVPYHELLRLTETYSLQAKAQLGYLITPRASIALIAGVAYSHFTYYQSYKLTTGETGSQIDRTNLLAPSIGLGTSIALNHHWHISLFGNYIDYPKKTIGEVHGKDYISFKKSEINILSSLNYDF